MNKLDIHRAIEHTNNTAEFPSVYTKSGIEIKSLYPIFGLCNEFEEMREKMYKSPNNFGDEIMDEAGDVTWYLLQVIDKLKLNTSRISSIYESTIHNGLPVFNFKVHHYMDIIDVIGFMIGAVYGRLKKVLRDTDFDTKGFTAAESYISVIEENIGKILAALHFFLETVYDREDEYTAVIVTCHTRNYAKLMARKEQGKIKGEGDYR
jgi:hypothetical protein